ncbi:unnamed protein product, partial [Polarella glacialis]
ASGGSLVTRTCIWVPTKEQAVAVGKAAGLDGSCDSVSLPESDWPFVASEAAGFRAALLWILAFGGGLSRTEPDGGRSVSPLMLELAREVGSGRVGSRLPPLKELPPPPDALRAELEKCASASGVSWGSRFASSRARLTLAICGLAYSSDPVKAADSLLEAAEAAGRSGHLQGEGVNSMLQLFLAESICSVSLLWHKMSPSAASPSGRQRLAAL